MASTNNKKREYSMRLFSRWDEANDRKILESQIRREAATLTRDAKEPLRREFVCEKYGCAPWVMSLIVCDREKVLGDIERQRVEAPIVLNALYLCRKLETAHPMLFDRLEETIRERFFK